MNVMLVAPTNTASGNAIAKVGAPANSSIAAPNAVDAMVTCRTPTLERLAVASAPISEPKLRVVNRKVKSESVPPNVRFTNSGNTTWKLNAKVPTIATITRGIQRSGVLRT